MDGTPLVFAGFATASTVVGAVYSKSPTLYKAALISAAAIASYASYRHVQKKRRKEAYVFAILAVVVALIALRMYGQADRGHFADLLRRINN